MVKTKVKKIPLSELGSNCWWVARFTGGICDRLERCNYPEKATCKAFKTKTIKSKITIHASEVK